MQTIVGVSASPGIAIARVIVLDSEEFEIPQRHINSDLVPAEIDRVNRAFDGAVWEMTELENQQQDLGKYEIRDLFAVHRHFLVDKNLRAKVIELISQKRLSAECAIDRTLEDVHQHFANVQNRYISERAADIVDVKKRLLKHVIDIKQSSLETLDHDANLYENL